MTLTYGMEIMHIPESVMQMLKSFHAGAAKVFQVLPEQTSNIGAVCNMGWLSLQGYLCNAAYVPLETCSTPSGLYI